MPAQCKSPMSDDLLQFNGRVKRVWRSPLYLLALAVVATVVLLLPIIYFLMIGGVAYGVYWHLTENLSLITTATESASRRAGLYMRVLYGAIYFTPLIAGAILILFMIKPIFARRLHEDRRVSLVRDHEPRLFAFV